MLKFGRQFVNAASSNFTATTRSRIMYRPTNLACSAFDPFTILIQFMLKFGRQFVNAASSNFTATTKSRIMYRPTNNSFASLFRSAPSGGRGRGQTYVGGNHQESRDAGPLATTAVTSNVVNTTFNRDKGIGQIGVGGSHQGLREGGRVAASGGTASGNDATFNRGRGRGPTQVRGSRQGSRGRGSGAAAGGTSLRIEALGRLLVSILRHKATHLNLDMRSDGYVRVQDLLRVNKKSYADVPLGSHSIDEIREAVRIDNKQRLGLLEENGHLFIRANQGHSVKVVKTESLLRPITSAEEIPVCVHGTYTRFLDSIFKSGLDKMTRLHVHFSSGLLTDGEVISGMRRDINVIIFLDVKKALEDGMKLYMSENKVILTEGFGGVVPAKYFQQIQLWPSRKPVIQKTYNSSIGSPSNNLANACAPLTLE